MLEQNNATSGELWWCNSHQREADFEYLGRRMCNPRLGGIMIPCRVVNLTGDAVIVRIEEPDA